MEHPTLSGPAPDSSNSATSTHVTQPVPVTAAAPILTNVRRVLGISAARAVDSLRKACTILRKTDIISHSTIFDVDRDGSRRGPGVSTCRRRVLGQKTVIHLLILTTRVRNCGRRENITLLSGNCIELDDHHRQLEKLCESAASGVKKRT